MDLELFLNPFRTHRWDLDSSIFFCSLLLECDLLAKKVPGGTPYSQHNIIRKGIWIPPDPPPEITHYYSNLRQYSATLERDFPAAKSKSTNPKGKEDKDKKSGGRGKGGRKAKGRGRGNKFRNVEGEEEDEEQDEDYEDEGEPEGDDEEHPEPESEDRSGSVNQINQMTMCAWKASDCGSLKLEY